MAPTFYPCAGRTPYTTLGSDQVPRRGANAGSSPGMAVVVYHHGHSCRNYIYLLLQRMQHVVKISKYILESKSSPYGEPDKPYGLLARLVPKEGFEPSWVFTHYALNVARLPIPPLRHKSCIDGLYFNRFSIFVNIIGADFFKEFFSS